MAHPSQIHSSLCYNTNWWTSESPQNINVKAKLLPLPSSPHFRRKMTASTLLTQKCTNLSHPQTWHTITHCVLPCFCSCKAQYMPPALSLPSVLSMQLISTCSSKHESAIKSHIAYGAICLSQQLLLHRSIIQFITQYLDGSQLQECLDLFHAQTPCPTQCLAPRKCCRNICCIGFGFSQVLVMIWVKIKLLNHLSVVSKMLCLYR